MKSVPTRLDWFQPQRAWAEGVVRGDEDGLKFDVEHRSATDGENGPSECPESAFCEFTEMYLFQSMRVVKVSKTPKSTIAFMVFCHNDL